MQHKHSAPSLCFWQENYSERFSGLNVFLFHILVMLQEEQLEWNRS